MPFLMDVPSPLTTKSFAYAITSCSVNGTNSKPVTPRPDALAPTAPRRQVPRHTAVLSPSTSCEFSYAVRASWRRVATTSTSRNDDANQPYQVAVSNHICSRHSVHRSVAPARRANQHSSQFFGHGRTSSAMGEHACRIASRSAATAATRSVMGRERQTLRGQDQLVSAALAGSVWLKSLRGYSHCLLFTQQRPLLAVMVSIKKFTPRGNTAT